MAKKINISFKENERDMQLLSEVMGAGDRSNFVKDCIQHYLDSKKNKSVENSTLQQENEFNIVNDIMNI